MTGRTPPMRFYLLLILVPGAAFAFGGLSTAGVLASVWPFLERRTTKVSAAARARLLALFRLAPAGAGVLAAVLVADALVRFEPRDTTEAPGMMLWFGAMLTLILFALAGRRSARAVRAAMNCFRLLREGARLVVRPDGAQVWVLDSQYPLAAIVGVFRTRLLLSRRVIDECTEQELDAILSHERAHVLRRDNIVRAAMLYFPDPFQPFTAGRAIERAWAAAAEEAADDAAAGTGAERRTVLASALVRVARMATSPMPEWIGGLAFYAGTNLESRVRRLLGTASAPARFSTAYGFVFLSAVSAGALLMTETVAFQLHNWMELAVRVIP